jgi:hypothetical protein
MSSLLLARAINSDLKLRCLLLDLVYLQKIDLAYDIPCV